ncbi:MAG: tetratricopeptide repeat protein [Pirellulaceae bacterium]
MGAGLAAAAVDSPWSWGYWPYENPYCTAPVVLAGTTIDYSQPLVLNSSPSAVAEQTPASGDAAASTPTDQASSLLDAARDAFMQGDYNAALAQSEQAIAAQPNGAVSHEFRALVLFALQRYKEAATTIYAVLSVGPGWDWTTMSSFYPNADTYSEQLRALEQSIQTNPNVAELRFLLAYHYMTCGYADAAATQLKAVVELNPHDQLSAQILSALTPHETAQQPAASGPATPVTAAALVGQWKASRADGTAIALSLTQDAKYTWSVVQKERHEEFSGDFTVADSLLVLKKDNSPVMVGEVKIPADNQFNFKLPGDNPSDPGLTFAK